MLEFFSTLGLILLVILVFNLMILVHELGHYWAAAWRGLKIDRFQIWFGKPWLKFERKGVQWGMGWLPLGGFVALPQMAPMEAIEGKNRSSESGDSEEEGGEAGAAATLPPISPLDKIIVAFAGPLFSFLLAVFFAVLVWIIGHPPQSFGGTVVGAVDPQGPAAEAGIENGDKILSIDGGEVRYFFGPVYSVQERVMLSRGEQVEVEVLRGEEAQPRVFQVRPKQHPRRWIERSEPRKIGVAFEMPLIVGEVLAHSPAAEIGLKKGDQILEINGETARSPLMLTFVLAANKTAEILVRSSDGQEQNLKLSVRKPDMPDNFEEEISGLGFENTLMEQELVKPSVGHQLMIASTQIFRTIRALTSSKSGVGVNDLAGPVGIGNMYYRMFDTDWRMVLWFSVILNVNLAILNLLPLPVLDGGHITLSLLEKLRGKPVHPKLLEPLYVGCTLLLFAFMGYKLLQETWLLGSGQEMGSEAAQEKPQFLPPEERTQLDKPVE